MKQLLIALFFALSTCFFMPMNEARADDVPFGEKDWEYGFEARFALGPQYTNINVRDEYSYIQGQSRTCKTEKLTYHEMGFLVDFEIGMRWPKVGVYWTHDFIFSEVISKSASLSTAKYDMLHEAGHYYETTVKFRGFIDLTETLELVLSGGIGLWFLLDNETNCSPFTSVFPEVLFAIPLAVGIAWHFHDNVTLNAELTYTPALGIDIDVHELRPTIGIGYTF